MKRNALSLVILSLLAIFIVSASSCNGQESADAMVDRALKECKSEYMILVLKKSFTMNIVDRNKKIVATYSIGYGMNPDKKRKIHEGDNRTPEGLYRIVEILSMDADKKTNSYAKLAALNRIYFKAKEGHGKYGKPKEDLGDNAYGPRFFLLNYPNDADRTRYKELVASGTIKAVKGNMPRIGFGIAIHGNSDEESIGHLCTSGCVRMYNSDIIELDQYVSIDMPVIIVPE